jgi:hypothetical protein
MSYSCVGCGVFVGDGGFGVGVGAGGRGVGVFAGGAGVDVGSCVGVGVSGGIVGVGVSGGIVGVGVSVGLGTMVGVAVQVGTSVFVGVGDSAGSPPTNPPKEKPNSIAPIVATVSNANVVATTVAMINSTTFLLSIYALLSKYKAYYNDISWRMQIRSDQQ